ncbi:MAG TPA: NAD(+) synthase, partial [Bauldia sp.]|nr:NAD(+) synthase [Bauldia sp.]
MNGTVVRMDSRAAPVAGNPLVLDAAAEVTRIADTMREQALKALRRRGAVVGLSGGIDSTVTAALAVKAFGSRKVLAVLMPEKDSDTESLRLGRMVADWLGIDSVVEDIEPALTAMGCYARRDDFIRRLVPEFDRGWGCKVVIGAGGKDGYNISHLVVQAPGGPLQKVRMPLDVYLGVIAATNMKQRTRKQIEYYHADRLNYAVVGTPNRLE